MRARWLPFVVLLAGCGAGPVENIVGSYFPSWILCAVLGAVAAAVVRQLLVMLDLEHSLLVPALTYLAMAAVFALVIWLLVFRR